MTKLVIHRFRNVVPGTTLAFDGVRNILIGKNGVGKSTLLSLLEGLLTGNDLLLGTSAFHVAYEMDVGDDRLSLSIELNCGTWTPPPPASRGVPNPNEPYPLLPFDLKLTGRFVGPGMPPIEWNYTAPSPTFAVTVDGVPSSTPPPGGQPFSFYVAPFPLAVYTALVSQQPAAHASVARLLLPFSAMGAARRFDEALESFDSLFGWSALLRATDRGRSLTASRPFDSMGAEYFARLLQCDLDRLREQGFVSWSSAEDTVLREFEHSTGIGDVSLEVPLRRVDVTTDGTAYDVGPCRVRVSRPDGTLFFHDDLSFGQKRLFAFLYFMNRGAPIVLADELSNGMHRAWIDLAVEKMSGRQSIIAAQNPLLLDRMGFTDAKQMQESLIFCREDNGRFVWENAPAEEMRDVFRAYDVGLQHVSDVLWQKGLW